jgi:adenylosuccinate lyase
MNVCPLDFRYGSDQMKKIFSEDTRLLYQLRVEAALAEAHAIVGNIPSKCANEISNKATLKYVEIARVKEIEKEIHHDVMAMVKALTETCGESGKYVHLGATSYDIVDSAQAIQMKEGLDIIEKNLAALKKSVMALAEKYKDTIMLGRTHGQYALPITFGLKMAVFASEIERQRKRIKVCVEEIAVGKMSGAVGSGASMGRNFFEIQEIVMNKLGLKTEIPSTQIVGRDRFIVVLSTLSNIATSLEKFATEIRNLQRNEIGELEESFEKKQVGSSTMPHKKNPIICEQICGLARVIRSTLVPAWGNAVQWHERDLCNSSSERFIIPHAFILTDWILIQMEKVFSDLKVYPDKMKKNIENSKGAPMAEAVMMLLVQKGMGRQVAHELLRKSSLISIKKEMHLKDVLLNNKKISQFLTEGEIENIFDPEKYLGESEKMVELTLRRLKNNV